MPYAIRKPCAEAGCPELVPSGRRYCDEHAGTYERRRGTRQQRGYGREHEAMRERMRPAVEAGTALCVRCGQFIKAGDSWVPDHNEDRSGYLGPSHKRCNDTAGGRAVRHRGAAAR